MQKHTVKRGRPAGSTTFQAEPAIAFGQAVRALRAERGIAQEEMAALASVERSHMGKIERGEHMPTLALRPNARAIFRINASELMLETEARLPKSEG